MGKVGRPRKFNVKDLVAAADVYLKNTPLPIVAEFALQQGITRPYLYELAQAEKEAGRPELSDAIKKITDTKAVVLEKGALLGKFNPSMAIFSLKQLGWKDVPDDGEKSEKVVILDDFK